jgi:hypothetical protein
MDRKPIRADDTADGSLVPKVSSSCDINLMLNPNCRYRQRPRAGAMQAGWCPPAQGTPESGAYRAGEGANLG